MPNHSGKRNWSLIHCLIGFWINDHSKKGGSTNIGKNCAETLQFEDFAVKNVFLFYYVHIFVKTS